MSFKNKILPIITAATIGLGLGHGTTESFAQEPPQTSAAPVYLVPGQIYNGEAFTVVNWVPNLNDLDATKNGQPPAYPVEIVGDGLSPQEVIANQSIMHEVGGPSEFLSDQDAAAGEIKGAPITQEISPQGLLFTDLNPNPAFVSDNDKIPNQWGVRGAGTTDQTDISTPYGYNQTEAVVLNSTIGDPIMYRLFNIDPAIAGSIGDNQYIRVSYDCKTTWYPGESHPVHFYFTDPINGAKIYHSVTPDNCPLNGFESRFFFIDFPKKVALAQMRGSFEIGIAAKKGGPPITFDNLNLLIYSQTIQPWIYTLNINGDQLVVPEIRLCNWPLTGTGCTQSVTNTDRWNPYVWKDATITGYALAANGDKREFTCEYLCDNINVLGDPNVSTNAETPITQSGQHFVFLPNISDAGCVYLPGDPTCYTHEVILQALSGSNTLVGKNPQTAVPSGLAQPSVQQQDANPIDAQGDPKPGDTFFKLPANSVVHGIVPNSNYWTTANPFWAQLVPKDLTTPAFELPYRYAHWINPWTDTERQKHQEHNCLVSQGGTCFMTHSGNLTVTAFPYTVQDLNKLKEASPQGITGQTKFLGQDAVYTVVNYHGIPAYIFHLKNQVNLNGVQTQNVVVTASPSGGVTYFVN